MEHSPSSRVTSTFPPFSPAWIPDVKFSLIFPTGVLSSFAKDVKDRVQAINRAAPASAAYAPLFLI